MNSQEVYNVEILHADSAIWETINGETIRRLERNVKLRHKGTLIDCDTATIYSNNNIDANGHVVVRKNSQTKVEGNILHYYSNLKLAVMNGNVVLTDKKSKLYSQDMTYDLTHDFGYYMLGGKMVNGESEVTSQRGYFYTKTSQAFFRDQVRVNHPKYKLDSDSLQYDTKLKRSIFKTSTKIENDSGYVWCNSGWHDEEKNQSSFGKGTYIYNSAQWIQTDSIFYDRKIGKSHIYKTFEYHDTAAKIHLFGDSAFMYNDNNSITAYKRPILIVESKDNKPTFIRGETLDSKSDTKKNKTLTATGRVRLYNLEFQAVSDTMIYITRDSLFILKKNNIIWNELNQISGNKIDMYMTDKKPKKMNIFNNGFIAQEELATHYNQINSDTIYLDFKNGKIDQLFAFGNAKSIYYGKDSSQGYIGINSTESYSLRAMYDSSKIQRIIFYQKPKATFYPVKEINETNRLLPNFKWQAGLRPKSKDDL